jgi:hypothetical protein
MILLLLLRLQCRGKCRERGLIVEMMVMMIIVIVTVSLIERERTKWVTLQYIQDMKGRERKRKEGDNK